MDDSTIARRPVITFATGEFIALAERYGVTPEFLALVALEKFTEDAPATLSLASGHSLVDRPCHECALNDACISAREPDRAACFL